MGRDPRKSGKPVRRAAERERLVTALRTSEARLRAVIENLPFDFWMIGEDGRYVMQNIAARELWGDLIGRRPEDVGPDEETVALWLDNNRRAFAGETVRGEVQLSAHGERRHFYNVVAPIVAEDRTVGILGINLDITPRKQVEETLLRRNEELQRANRELERLGRSKDQLTAMISHELRTPLVTGLGYIEMLLDNKLGPISTAVRSRLSIARRNLRRLARLIDGVLRYHRLVSAGFDPAKLKTSAFDVGQLAEELLEERSAGAGPAPQLERDPDLPRVSGDRELIRMALANLLDNAVVHAGAGATIRVRLRREEDSVHVEVEDNGVGIPAQIRDTVLDPFVRGEETHGSCGLGLAIVRAILKAHGSTINLHSEPHQGTRVEFRLRRWGHSPPSNLSESMGA